MQESAGNEYQGLSIDGISITVYATQDTVESDSTGDKYDANATYDMPWDGKTTTPVTENEDDGKYHISTASQLVWLMDNTQNANSAYINETIVLDGNIDLGGHTVKGLGSEICNFAGNFDGQGYTISNFVINRTTQDTYAGLFNYVTYGTISNLTVANATINGDQSQVGALVGSLNDNATVKDCSVVNCTVVANRKVGGAVGYVCGATVENVSVKDTTIYVESTDATQYGKVVGFENTGAVVNNISDENVTIHTGYAFVSSFENFDKAIKNGCGHVTLTGDIINITVPHTGGSNPYEPYQVADAYTIAAGNELTVDFNGHIFTAPVRLFKVEGGATLNLINSDTSGKQSGIYFNQTDSDPNFAKNAYGIYTVHNGGKGGAYGTLNIGKNVTLGIGIENASAQPTGMIYNCGATTLDGGELIAAATSAVYIFASPDGHFTMKNGAKITLYDENATGITSYINSNAQVNIEAGCSITGSGTSYIISTFSSSYKYNIAAGVINTEKGPQE